MWRLARGSLLLVVVVVVVLAGDAGGVLVVRQNESARSEALRAWAIATSFAHAGHLLVTQPRRVDASRAAVSIMTCAPGTSFVSYTTLI